MEWTVITDERGVRLDKFLASRDRLGSRRRASVAIDRGKVFINAMPASSDDGSVRLDAGDVVRVWMDRPGSSRGQRRSRRRDLRILYEDDAIVVVDKPARLLAVPLERRRGAPSTSDQLVEYLRSHGKRKPLTVHRIDRDTSGLVVFAKQAAARARLQEQFASHTVERIYRAVVYGHPDPGSGTWRDSLAWDRKALLQRAADRLDRRAKDAISEYHVLERFRDASLVEIRLVTGKRNQIRVQAGLRGHTLVGERRYVSGPEPRPIAFERQALHAFRLAFAHPTTGQLLRFEAPMPADLTSLVARLRQSA